MKFKDVKVGQRFMCNYFEMKKVELGTYKCWNMKDWNANAIHTDSLWPVRISLDREVELIETKEESK